jgi:uncharacterized protein (TIGR02246 family)
MDETLRDAILELVAAWNSNDAHAFAALFTETAQYVGADGVRREGRPAIEGLLGSPDRHTRITIEQIVSLHRYGSVAQAEFRWATEPGAAARRGTARCVLAWRPDGWRFAALQNHDTAPPSR